MHYKQLLSRMPGADALHILVYHRVLAHKDPFRATEPDRHEFEQQIRTIARCFNPIRLDQAVTLLQQDSLPPNSVAITFDDGYADNLTVASSILDRYQIQATCFVATGFLAKGMMWNDLIIEACRARAGAVKNARCVRERFRLPELDAVRLAHELIRQAKYLPDAERAAFARTLASEAGYQPESPMLATGELRKMHQAGWEIGAHTVNHPILSNVSDEQLLIEAGDCKSVLQDIIQDDVTGFAYPNGRKNEDYTDREVSMLTDLGYQYAVTTNRGSNTRYQDRYQLSRFTPWHKNPLAFTARVAASRCNIGIS